MNYYTHLETSKFRVKNATKFKEEFDQKVHGEDSNLFIEKDGIFIQGTNIQHEDYIDSPTGLVDMIMNHIVPESECFITRVFRSAHDTDLGADFMYVRDQDFTFMEEGEIFEVLRGRYFPKPIEAKVTKHCSQSQQWIEEGLTYTATGLTSDGKYLVRISDQNVVPWDKEDFYELR